MTKNLKTITGLWIIGIIFSLLLVKYNILPTITTISRFKLKVKQQAQFHDIGVALEFFNSDFNRIGCRSG